MPQTGIYTVYHYQHRMPHAGLLVAGQLFPTCRQCGNRVRFELLSNAQPISLDSDFTGAHLLSALADLG